jgi:NAD(P)-dependent dehydrogenase (short-subunit alcohol dehydrogenase family)
VNISSIRGLPPKPGRLAYCAVKAAAIMATRVAAREWSRSSVRVSAVAPGVQRTPMWEEDVARGTIDQPFYRSRSRWATRRPGGRRPAGRLLCSDNASYISCSVVTIDSAATSIPAG